MPRDHRHHSRELALLQTFLDAGRVFLWREDTYRVLQDGEHTLVHTVMVLRIPEGGWFGYPASHDIIGWSDIMEFAADLLGFFRNDYPISG